MKTTIKTANKNLTSLNQAIIPVAVSDQGSYFYNTSGLTIRKVNLKDANPKTQPLFWFQGYPCFVEENPKGIEVLIQSEIVYFEHENPQYYKRFDKRSKSSDFFLLFSDEVEEGDVPVSLVYRLTDMYGAIKIDKDFATYAEAIEYNKSKEGSYYHVRPFELC